MKYSDSRSGFAVRNSKWNLSESSLRVAGSKLTTGHLTTADKGKTMAKIAIVYHSNSGHTKKLAEAVERGAKNAGGDVSLLSVEELGADAPGWTILDAADA